MTYIDWLIHRRLHGTITPGPGYTTPAAYEAASYRQTISAPAPATQQPEQSSNVGRVRSALRSR